ncbi:MAG: 50S ribosomal protein L18 [Candidatus Magasanikbacteria bacterium CG10_big_fil_rev_8_21_14_0_10_40_10]|uniref:Large ribosomal subunit protein uL18 n=1 Tax=Candidatus Magasanikbacteria bacterium CG10_big_fil_rev_8_21_14_0_10_40_10 TaxID=1974648 RepID=A0A2M6W589_9BACT|nr:MAG: 50S ribosomal protein L18 [Candidatus Magasanikbacteria bacterium CG10_big_fil_rev_8_21_14_0_10_40_10]
MKRFITNIKSKTRKIRHNRIRARIKGTVSRPRLSVFRGLRSINLQLIDDQSGKTLCQAHSRQAKDASLAKDLKGKVAIAYQTGFLLAQKAKDKKITEVVFDRGGNRFHGRVKAAADGAREGGLKF